jgi:prepilin signal peptidase PulO-like enzyme (type II secretory pathway)
MHSILSIFESNYLFFMIWALLGGFAGLFLQTFSRYLTHHINQALEAEDAGLDQMVQAECLLSPPLRLLPSMEPALPLIMLLMAVFCGAWQPWPEALVSLFFVANCLLLAAVDARTGILPNALNIILISSGLGWQLFIKGGVNISDILAQVEYVLAMGLGYVVPISMAWAYSHMARVQPMGRGDAKMLAGLGAWLGLNGLVTAVFIATLGASFWVLGLMLKGRYQRHLAIPFGPFLAMGATIYLIWSVWQSHA